jgi:hypothetical protein
VGQSATATYWREELYGIHDVRSIGHLELSGPPQGGVFDRPVANEIAKSRQILRRHRENKIT